MENIGKKIYNLRLERDISQDALAEAVDVTRQTVSKWERNIVVPTRDNRIALCKYFEVQYNYFLTEEEKALYGANLLATEEGAEHAHAVTECVPAMVELTTAVNEYATIVSQTGKKEPRFKTLKIVLVVVGMVLLALATVACVIAAHLLAEPNENGAWSKASYSIDYLGIIFICMGIVLTAVLITLIVLFIIRVVKNHKNFKL